MSINLKNRPFLIFAVIAAILGLAAFVADVYWGDNIQSHLSLDRQVRSPQVAGAFYPDDPAQLRSMVDALIAKEPPKNLNGPLFALVAPHAGYPYSASIAARAFAQIEGHKYKRVVVLAPSHYDLFPFASIYDGDAYATPLGEIPIDKAFVKALAKSNPSLKLSSTGHGCVLGRCEHAIEVELPFLQEALGDFKLVPIVMGTVNYDVERAVGVALAEEIKLEGQGQEPDTLIVASSDLSHYHPYDQAVALDRKVLDAIRDNDYFSLSMNVESRVWEACGGGPIVAAMMAAQRLGANDSAILARANSGDVTGDKLSVVGYGAAALFRNDKKQITEFDSSFSLTSQERSELLELAKKSVESMVLKNKLLPLAGNLSPALQMARGAFVTLKEYHQLRGCIGFITPSKSLAETVRDVAALAATKDPRFSSVRADELGSLDYEISVLSPLRRVASIGDIRIGRDGLMIRKYAFQGILLPQVPIEQGWSDSATFAAQTARKAGLPSDAWKDENSDLFAFSAIVFSK